MTWAARYSRTEQPELTIWRDGVEVDRVPLDHAEACISARPCSCPTAARYSWRLEVAHDSLLRADIAARVPVRECEETQACTNWAMPDGRCHHLHGGGDEL